MKLINKFISVIMIVVLCTAFISLSAFAANEPTIKLTGPTAAVKPGDTFTVTFDVVNNPGIIGMSADLVFNSEVFTFTSVADAGAMSGAILNKATETNNLYWNDELADDNYTADATYATLTFTVSESAANGTYDISLTPVAKNIINFDMDKVTFVAQGCTITVQGDEPVVETKTVGFAASFERTEAMQGVKFTVTTSATNVASQTVTKEVAFGSTFVENGTVKLGLQVNKVPKDVTLKATAEAY